MGRAMYVARPRRFNRIYWELASSPNSNLARRRPLMLAIVNFGGILSFSTMYVQNVEPLVILTSALIYFVGINAFLSFLYKRARAAKRD
jgi:hypothetical protein